MNANSDQILDGYRLIRFLGRGGFGEVWLCRSEAMGDLRALKIIPTTSAEHLQKEYDSLLKYRKSSAQLRSPHLLSIEHVNMIEDGLFYVMPLADGIGAAEPNEAEWRPLTLAQITHLRKGQTTWFSSSEVIGIIKPIMQALQILSDAGLVHRDVKPENILFFDGKPCLGDISLLGEDAHTITLRGTLGYVRPSWYLGGLPDMYGVAVTLYHLLTGNSPDKMGRANFFWPPQGEKSLSPSERSAWMLLHKVIRRATEEKVAERYVDFRTMAEALSETAERPFATTTTSSKRRANSTILLAVSGIFIFVVLGVFSFTRSTTPKARPIAFFPATPTQDSQTSYAEQQAAKDANCAYAALTSIQQDLAYIAQTSLDQELEEDFALSVSQNSLFQQTLQAIYANTCVPETFAPELALRNLDICLDEIKIMNEIPNVRLIRLLLMQAAGKNDEVAKGLTDPVFTLPGSDNINWRTSLLCQLHAADKAEALFDCVLLADSLSARNKYELFIRRADVRARRGKYTEAHEDTSAALAATEQETDLKAELQIQLIKLQSNYPGYADYLKTISGK